MPCRRHVGKNHVPGTVLVISILVAAGFLLRFLLPAPRDATENSTEAHGQATLDYPYTRWVWVHVAVQLSWAAVIGFGILALIQTGTRGALIGLAAGSLAIPVGMIIWGNRRAIKPAVLVFVGIIIAVSTVIIIDRTIGFPGVSACSGQSAAARFDSLADTVSLTDATANELSLSTRVMSIKTGSLGLLDRPIRDWGPENLGYAFDSYVDGWRLTSFEPTKLSRARTTPVR